MGIIKAALTSIESTAKDQYLETIEPANMSDQTVLTSGVRVQKGVNRGNAGVITDGSIVHVYPNMMMLLIDGGKIIDYTAEEGYYTVKNELAPSMFNGDLNSSIEEAFFRIKFGGQSPQHQEVLFINLQEIKGIKFGTATPLQYFDNFYNAELFLRTHGTYSIKVVDPILFYENALPKNRGQVSISEINDQYVQEFLTALNSCVNQYSADGERISLLPSKGLELAKRLSELLDESWKKLRGIQIVSVAVSSISYTEESQKLINTRNEGAMLGDSSIREGYVQKRMADAIALAGNNSAGALTGFAAVNMAAQRFSGATEANQPQEAASLAATAWQCPTCGKENEGNFCSNCGAKKPEPAVENANELVCQSCGARLNLSQGLPKFCPECGKAIEHVQ